jgi:glycolate oxidase FAD binding subunit
LKLGELQSVIRQSGASRTPLRIAGHGSKDFYGEPPRGEALSTLGLNGVTAYEPSELFISALAGTPLADVDALLAQQRQRLAAARWAAWSPRACPAPAVRRSGRCATTCSAP